MSYRVTIDRADCLNCGICMDVCPVQGLDMTRTLSPPIESGAAGSGRVGRRWMMEFPIQTGVCIGCQLCTIECPTSAIDVAGAAAQVDLAPAQGPIYRGPGTGNGWAPLSAYTRESLKEVHSDPWGNLFRWRPVQRPESWQVWRTWDGDGEVPGGVVAPCQEACPVGTDSGRYISLVAEGRYAEALGVAAEHNPFPSVCGRVCTAPCEVACRRAELDEPVAIRELKRYAADHGAVGYPRAVPPELRRSERVAIVGAGPTGLSAAYALVRQGYGVTVYEAMEVPGGMMALGIPEYRLPKRVLQAEIDRILGLGVELVCGTALGPDFSLEQLRAKGYNAILLATGAPKSQPLRIPGEDLAGVWPATVFLKRVNLGEIVRLSGETLVIGGGSTAMDAARSSWRAGADRVRLLYRRSREDMPAQVEEIRAAEHEGVVIDTLVQPVEVLGRQGSITGLRCLRLEVAGRDKDGRNRVVPIPGSTFDIPARTLMVAIGEAPDPSILPAGSSIQAADWGGLLTHPDTLQTAEEDVFAAGDLATGPRSVIEGVAAGQQAAWAIDRHLRGLPPARYLPAWRRRRVLPETERVAIDLRHSGRAQAEFASPAPANGELYREVSLGLAEVSARQEAQRCLRCDVITSCSFVEVKKEVPL